jgi:hypothetical protein
LSDYGDCVRTQVFTGRMTSSGIRRVR